MQPPTRNAPALDSFAHTQARVATLIGRLAPTEGTHDTALPDVQVFRVSSVGRRTTA